MTSYPAFRGYDHHNLTLQSIRAHHNSELIKIYSYHTYKSKWYAHFSTYIQILKGSNLLEMSGGWIFSKSLKLAGNMHANIQYIHMIQADGLKVPSNSVGKVPIARNLSLSDHRRRGKLSEKYRTLKNILSQFF
jgi:hypothetical protein